jgi:DNA-binding MurR/RpiR family transcriptional regulator
MKGNGDSKASRKKVTRATLSDVAKEAGVSVMTVSKFVHA